MAFFQFRKARDEPAAKLAPAPTVEAIRRRAMHRLIGAAVLVLAGVIGFPLVFDNQPRPIPVDLPIEIADKNKVRPLVAPAPAPVAAVAPSVSPPATKPVAVDESAPTPATVATANPAAPPAPVAAVPAPGPEKPVVTDSAVAKALEAKSTDASKARALLEGKVVAAAASPVDSRFVVQVGAFSDTGKVREVRQKLEGAGLKTYAQVVETKDGNRTRVRVGPFSDRDEAQRAADKIRKLDLSAAILTL